LVILLLLLLSLLKTLGELVEHVRAVRINLGRLLVVLLLLLLCVAVLLVRSFLFFEVGLRVLLLVFLFVVLLGLDLVVIENSLVAFRLDVEIVVGFVLLLL